MRVLLYITLILLLSGAADTGRERVVQKVPATAQYEAVFAGDYRDALSFVHENKAAWDALPVPASERQMLLAIVFPELIRYSMFRDFFETAALSTVYVRYGSEAVDFSIGPFQMKPSFAEKLEQHISQSEKLSRKYHSIISYSSKDAEGIRKERVERLGKLSGQLQYLGCFYELCSERFGDIRWKDDAEKLRFFATAYNHDPFASKEEIERWAGARTFPYGTGYRGKQYAYSDISVYFFNNNSKNQEL